MKGAVAYTCNGFVIGIVISYMTYILFSTDFFAPKTDCSLDTKKNEENEFFNCVTIGTAAIVVIFTFSVLLKKRNISIPSWRPEISSPTEKILKEAFGGSEKTVILQIFPKSEM